ncbi:hypothetical protein DVH24_021048 [Malus domestica]|uniref:ABC transporter domain-containing protein n=1 Tax=Malus domestica TaxID=3750 RepID=A0A498JB05_MALDO|nr:hypothetical protein DVH24_021048 [Malus domestica]
MTLFLRTEMHKNTVDDGGIFMGAMFFTVIIVMFNGFSELAMTIMKLPVFFKQRDLLFYPAWAYSLPTWILKIPISFIEVAVWVVMTYYVIGFDPNIERFFRQYLLLLLLNQMASGLFRFMGALGRNIIVANTFGSFALLAVLVLGGFVLSRDDVKKWWVWGYWASPMMYGQNAIAVNEFLGDSWSHVPPNSTESLGIMVLKSRGVFIEPYWYWIGVGATVGYIFLFNFFYTLALKFLNPFEKPQAVLSKEALAEKLTDQTGDSVELSSRGKNSSDPRNESRRSVSLRTLSARVGSITEANQNKKRGMVLPFEPLWITFDEIKYAVDMPQEMKTQGVTEDRLPLLKGVTGAFRPGVLTALMGISGAGKTTLMDVLAGRKTGGFIEGNITISGYPKKQETFARISGYCEQTDIHSPHVTVYESLVYSASLRLPPEVDSATRKLIILASITSSIFLRIKMHKDSVVDGGVYMGALFFAVIVAMFNGVSELNMAIMKLPVFYKQRDLLFFPSWAYSLPAWILKIPVSLAESAIWVVITYYVIGFDPYVERFFKQYIVLLCINQMASGLFRLIAALGRDVTVANTTGSFALLIIMVLGGFVLSRDAVPKWWLWGYWVSPLMYGQNAITVNEFLGKSWRQVPPNSTESLGVLILKSHGIFPEAKLFWIGVAALIGYIFLFNLLLTLALHYLDPLGKPQTVLTKESMAERNFSRNGEFIELIPRGKISSESERVGRTDEANGKRKRGMVLPFHPLSLTFDEIRYAIDMPQRSHLLRWQVPSPMSGRSRVRDLGAASP